MKKIATSILAVSSLFLASCSSDDDGGAVSTDTVVAPIAYEFGRSEASTVSFSGQSTRIAMAEELVEALKAATNSEVVLKAMFAHEEGASDFSDTDLNASDKSIRSKVAASTDFYSDNATDATAIKADFDGWIEEQVADVFPNYEVTAVAGTAGAIQEAGGGSTRYVTAKGVELNQIFAKGLIGGLMTDQILNNYLGKAVLDEGTNITDNDDEELVEGKNYTNMEHKWDEAFGYLYGAEEDVTMPVLNIDSFLNKYLSRVEGDADFTGIADDIYDAFKLGRQAIVVGNYEVRDEQAEILREKISTVIGVRAVYYLQQGKNVLEATGEVDYASAFHDLSEGLGFVYSLQFTRKPNTTEPYFTKTQVDDFLSRLLEEGNGLWEASTSETLEAISEEIAAAYDFTVEQAGS